MAETVNTPQPPMAPEIPFRVITPDDVRASIKRAKGSLEKAAEEIVWQIEMEGWKTLGYRSWTAMREAEYGGAAFMVPAKQRPELVARIRAAGQTQQEIADTAGVNRETVANDLRSMSESGIEVAPPVITNARGQQRPASYTPRPAPVPPRRSPLPDSYWRAVYKLQKAVESVERLHNDDRFLANREGLHERNWRDIGRASALLWWVENDLEDSGNKCDHCEARIESNWAFERRCKACREGSN